MMEYRVRTKRDDAWVDKYRGSQVTPEMVNLLLTQEARVFRPDGKPLCVYLPGAAKDLAEQTYPDFSKIRMTTDNRGYAAGSERVKRNESDTRTRTAAVTSGILGAFERSAAHPSCRLTAFTAQEVEKWERIQPMFRRIADLFAEHVPDRYAAQVKEAEQTHSDWIIPGTPFTTITVNNTYPTGIHTDKGDLDAGFSTIVCIRRGQYTGGWLGFPQYGVFADLQDGDVLLMDAHDWHGNTPIVCSNCSEAIRKPGHQCDGDRTGFYTPPGGTPERISIVSYFRTKMVQCGSQIEEDSARATEWENRTAKKIGLVPETPEEKARREAEEKRGTWAERRAYRDERIAERLGNTEPV